MRFKRLHIIFFAIVILTFLVVPVVQVVKSEPGTEDDPVVAKSYVDARINELTEEIDKLTETVHVLTLKVEDLNKQLEGNVDDNKGQASKFEVIRLTAGQQLVAGASAEIIVRSGIASAVQGEKGGLSDVTSDQGIELMTGDKIPLNHLLIVSRDDGRGLVAFSDEVYLLFKGEYTIK